jgi:exopolysaccharide biosynthesis polyprenyl glycosylphosphotransferase
MIRSLENQILHRSRFLDRLRVEKRRSDRSKSSISVALFCFDREKEDHFEQISNLLVSLKKNTRETDIIGWVDHDIIGLLLPDTNETGTHKCVAKIVNGNGKSSCSVITGTYPDQLFQKLLDKDQLQPDLYPLYLEESSESAGLPIALKRGIDIVGSFCGLLFLSPLIVMTALSIKVTSPGPVVFRQLRLGQKGARFPFYKFRSMRTDTDDQIHRNYVENLIRGNLDEINQGEKEKPLYKIKEDPRVTRVGKIIRKLSIDELPQLYNVLKGEMSLVGPRPPLPYEVEKYEPWHLRRILEVKPGMTGLWQVEGRSKTSFNDMVRLDLRYVRNWSLGLDLKILIKTVKAVLKPTGAL